jgi:hypothetical protein
MRASAIDVSSERLSRITQWLDACGVVLRVAAPMVDLLVRLLLAKAFFAWNAAEQPFLRIRSGRMAYDHRTDRRADAVGDRPLDAADLAADALADASGAELWTAAG